MTFTLHARVFLSAPSDRKAFSCFLVVRHEERIGGRTPLPSVRTIPRQRASLSLILLCLTRLPLTSCKPHAAPPNTLDSIAQTYLQLALALGERDPDSLDYTTAPQQLKASVHRDYPTLEEINQQATHLLTQLNSSTTDPDRTHFLILQLHAIQTRTAMLRGHLLPFDTEAQALFHTTRLPDTEAAHRAVLLQEISAMLPPSPQSVANRYTAYDQRFLIPPARLAAVMQAALAGCRAQTLKYIALPAGESVQLTFTRNQPWSAFSRFEGHAHSTILLNLDLPTTVDGAVELACHEGYPGHHVFNSLHDQALAQNKHFPEVEAQLTFSPESYVSEAAAAYAPRLAFTLDQRIAFERDVLFPLAGLNPAEADRHVRLSRLLADLSSAQPAIARDFLDGRLEFIRAEDELARQTLMLHAEPVLLYLNEYRSYMLAYTDGPRRMERFLNRPTARPDSRIPWDRLVQLATTESLWFELTR